jgi:Tfp pilus assembly protein PilO
VTLTPRDRKIVLALVPLLVLVGYWFLLLSPQRKDAAAAGEALAKQERRLEASEQKLTQLSSAKTSFASDYGTLVRLGKAVPSSVDMPTLLVQLDAATKGTGIRFTKVKTGERDQSAAASSTQAPKAPGTGNGSQGAAAGGKVAQTGAGKAAESAGNATNGANASSSSSQAQAGGAAPPSGQPGGGAGPAGLDTVPLELGFKGRFFRLADFFHEVKRFVRSANGRIAVNGRLLTIDSLKFTSTKADFPNVSAEVKATVYLAPKTQGNTAGASPSGPAQAAAPSGTPPAPPTATASP